jgi:hypothetical protein
MVIKKKEYEFYIVQRYKRICQWLAMEGKLFEKRIPPRPTGTPQEGNQEYIEPLTLPFPSRGEGDLVERFHPATMWHPSRGEPILYR